MESEPIPILVTSSAFMQGPGPAAYDTRTDILKGKPGTSIGKRSDPKVESSSPPFVALPPTIGTGKKFTMSGRPKDSGIESTPGPYCPPPKFGGDSPAYKIGNRTKDLSQDCFGPGPGEYMISKGIGGRPMSFHGPKNRSMAVEDRSPGPGAYDIMHSPRENSPKCHIGVRNEIKNGVDGPGPGAYDVRSGIEINKYRGVIGSRNAKERVESTPGPSDYAYENELLKSVPKLHIGSRTEVKSNTNSPGPYIIPSSIGTGPRYSMRGRPKESQMESTPGVCFTPPRFGLGSPRYHISPRFSVNDREISSPGPGSYYTSKGLVNLKKAPAFHGPRNRSLDVADRSPGPAYYNTATPLHSSPRISIKGNSASKDSLPHTGEYVVLKSTLTGPKFTISPRSKVQVTYG